tara:strand:- start:71 stop:310 length:240 start_codon:yes stop_codon:yes gene_type:complete
MVVPLVTANLAAAKKYKHIAAKKDNAILHDAPPKRKSSQQARELAVTLSKNASLICYRYLNWYARTHSNGRATLGQRTS